MWEYIELPLNFSDFGIEESVIKQCAAKKCENMTEQFSSAARRETRKELIPLCWQLRLQSVR